MSLAVETPPAEPECHDPPAGSLGELSAPSRQSYFESSCAIPGSEEIGTVHFLRQIHCVYTETDPQLIAVGRVQHSILCYLQDKGLHSLFVEGQYRSFDLSEPKAAEECGNYHYWLMPEHIRKDMSADKLVPQVKGIFSEGSWRESPSDRQLLMLGSLGAGLVQACIESGVSLHRTVSAAADTALGDKQRKLSADDPQRDRLCYEIRERVATNEVAAHIANHPGGEAALIYGRKHEFKDDFEWRYRGRAAPKLVDVRFPKAEIDWERSYETAQTGASAPSPDPAPGSVSPEPAPTAPDQQ